MFQPVSRIEKGNTKPRRPRTLRQKVFKLMCQLGSRHKCSFNIITCKRQSIPPLTFNQSGTVHAFASASCTWLMGSFTPTSCSKTPKSTLGKAHNIVDARRCRRCSVLYFHNPFPLLTLLPQDSPSRGSQKCSRDHHTCTSKQLTA